MYGNFKHVLHRGEAPGKVSLASIPHAAGTYGVGALADLRGEILVWDGRVLVSPGESSSGSTRPPATGDQAALLVIGRVKTWAEVPVTSTMSQQGFERFLIDSARANGIETNAPFPFVVVGEITDYQWHVVTGTAKGGGAGAQHQQGHANNRTFSGAGTRGKLVGFHADEAREGVISHPGERLHVHFTDDDLKVSGHVDRFGVGKGATLLLPKP